jgi:hypothetical protein
MSKSSLNIDETNDFGFSFSHESEIVSTELDALNREILDLKSRLKQVHDIFLPLLLNLSKDPEKPMIKWPNRLEVIQKQIVKLKDLTRH